MTFNLDFALFYAYTLCLFAFLVFWLIPELFRALAISIRTRIARRQLDRQGPSEPPRVTTRLDAFTRI